MKPLNTFISVTEYEISDNKVIASQVVSKFRKQMTAEEAQLEYRYYANQNNTTVLIFQVNENNDVEMISKPSVDDFDEEDLEQLGWVRTNG